MICNHKDGNGTWDVENEKSKNKFCVRCGKDITDDIDDEMRDLIYGSL